MSINFFHLGSFTESVQSHSSHTRPVMGITSAPTILRDQIKGRVQLNDAERQTLAEISQKLGQKPLEDVAHVVKPDTDFVN